MKNIARLLGSLIIGIIIGFVIFAFTPIGLRYELITNSPGNLFYRIDKWTGETQFCYALSLKPVNISCNNVDAF